MLPGNSMANYALCDAQSCTNVDVKRAATLDSFRSRRQLQKYTKRTLAAEHPDGVVDHARFQVCSRKANAG